MPQSKLPCKHCGQAFRRHAGLCATCDHDPQIRALYPIKHHWQSDMGPSEAELDRMITEQLACKPSWWREHTLADPEPFVIPHVNLSQRGRKHLSD